MSEGGHAGWNGGRTSWGDLWVANDHYNNRPPDNRINFGLIGACIIACGTLVVWLTSYAADPNLPLKFALGGLGGGAIGVGIEVWRMRRRVRR